MAGRHRAALDARALLHMGDMAGDTHTFVTESARETVDRASCAAALLARYVSSRHACSRESVSPSRCLTEGEPQHGDV